MVRKKCPEEHTVTLYINRYELVSIQLSRVDWEDWAIGYLFSEGIIDQMGDLKRLIIDDYRGKIWADLMSGREVESFLQQRRHVTAGCGRGVTFRSISDVGQLSKVDYSRTTTLSYLQQKMREFSKLTPLYLETGGMHAACLINSSGEFIVREDIGRHNAVDKVFGYAVRERLNPKDLILLTTGRISYEMLSKAARFGVGIIGSRTAATKQAVELADHLEIEVIGYIRGQMASVYTSGDRITDRLPQVAAMADL
ncbi:MAG TPA: formate dehydrogenase accessory sulfurtransferase FdhD [Bacillota bacterium]|nr:formate dehydrogenase accessory sulfurtransferase FdhD [Bacillota bacterium]